MCTRSKGQANMKKARVTAFAATLVVVGAVSCSSETPSSPKPEAPSQESGNTQVAPAENERPVKAPISQVAYQRPAGTPVVVIPASDFAQLNVPGVKSWEVYLVNKARVVVGVDAAGNVVTDIRVHVVQDPATHKQTQLELWTVYPKFTKFSIDTVNNKVLHDTLSQDPAVTKLREALAKDFTPEYIKATQGIRALDDCASATWDCGVASALCVAATGAAVAACAATPLTGIAAIACAAAVTAEAASCADAGYKCAKAWDVCNPPTDGSGCGCGGCGACGCGGCGGCGCGGGGGPLIDKELAAPAQKGALPTHTVKR
jgi:hypothetical protein